MKVQITSSKLGYGGTKEEMARLLDDASLLAGKEFKMGNFADIIEAIHVIQENMGITGTTAQEASETINGSIASWKSALDNLLTGIGRNENIDQLVDNLVASTEDVIANLVPAIRRASEGFMQVMRVAVVKIGPQVMDAFRDIWNNKLPGMLTSAANGIIGLINDLFGTNIPKIGTIELPTWEELQTIIGDWWDGVREKIRTIATWTVGIFTEPSATASAMQSTFARWWQMTARPTILSISTWALNLFGLPKADENTIKSHVKTWWDGIVGWVQNACVWTLQMFGMPQEDAESIADAIKTWFSGVLKALGGTLKVAYSLLDGDAEATLAALEEWWDGIKESASAFLVLGVKIVLPTVGKIAKTIGDTTALAVVKAKDRLVFGLEMLSPSVEKAAQDIIDVWEAIKDVATPHLVAGWRIIGPQATKIATTIKDTWDKAVELLTEKVTLVWDLISPTVDSIVKSIKNLWKDAKKELGDFLTLEYWFKPSGAGKSGADGGSALDKAGQTILYAFGLRETPPEYAVKTTTSAGQSDDEPSTGSGQSTGWVGTILDSVSATPAGPIVVTTDWESLYGGGGGGGKPGTEDVVTELETVKTELQGLRADLIAAVNSLANRPIAVNGKIITDIVGQGILRKARATFG